MGLEELGHLRGEIAGLAHWAEKQWREQQRTNGLLEQLIEEIKLARPTKREPRKKAERGELPELAVIWNHWAERMPSYWKPVEWMAASGERFRSAKARWDEKPNADFWHSVVKKMALSAFCRGENSRKWKADFDFLIRPDTAAKVLEGKYDSRKGDEKKGEIDL